jgi:molybdopterin converting factor small subunit
MTMGYDGKVYFPVQFTVTFIANQRQIVGMKELEVQFSSSPPLAILIYHLCLQFPGLSDVISDTIAVNGKVVPKNYEFQNDDNVIFIPHIGGG